MSKKGNDSSSYKTIPFDSDTFQFESHGFGYHFSNWDGSLPYNNASIESQIVSWLSYGITIDLLNYKPTSLKDDTFFLNGSLSFIYDLYETYYGIWRYNRESLGYYDGAYHYRYHYKTYYLFRHWILSDSGYCSLNGKVICGNRRNTTFNQWLLTTNDLTNLYIGKTYNKTNGVYVFNNDDFELVDINDDFKQYYVTDSYFDSTDSQISQGGDCDFRRMILQPRFLVNSFNYDQITNQLDALYRNAIFDTTPPRGDLLYNQQQANIVFDTLQTLPLYGPKNRPYASLGECVLTFTQ